MAGNLRQRKQGKSASISVPSPTDDSFKNEPASSSEGSNPHSTDGLDEGFTITPLSQRMILMRLDVAPFALVYAFLLAADFLEVQRLLVTTAWGISLFAHVALVLLCQWRVSVKAKIGFNRKELSVPHMNYGWTHCLVESTQDSASGESVSGIVPVRYEGDEKTVAVISFQDHTFRCSQKLPDLDVSLWQRNLEPNLDNAADNATLRFRSLVYPSNLPLNFYAKWNGHENVNAVSKAFALYGENTTILQLPRFEDLLFEQLVAPFFLFQIFCVILWSLDEYWYYALFTLFALLMFESTVSYNRILALKRLHNAGHKGNDRIWVRRGGHQSGGWVSIATRELVPGDLVSLSSARGSQPLPADICLIAGSAVVDEALLTGESTPQLKHSLDVVSTNGKSSSPSFLDIQNSSHKESILFGGTVLLVSNPDDTSEATYNTPNDGVIGCVIRTGFETAQGSLLRTMAHSSKTADGVHTWETFFFIFMLVCFAFVAAGWVLHEGWYDDRRNRFRLLLHVVIIITSVVPPELPMELSLAVTNSVAALMRRCQVYCTEHFRIPWAGEVNVCCFDKTGTLTSDEMILRGVRVFEAGEEKVEVTEDSNLRSPTDDPLPHETQLIMAACHSLAFAQTKVGKEFKLSIVGDPLEKAVFSKLAYRLNGKDTIVGPANSSIRILHRFAFSSALKKMTVIAVEEGKNHVGKLLALTKGAPETMKDLLNSKSIPCSYDDIAHHHMSRGRRVLALAYREVGSLRDLQYIKDNGREVVEKDLTFAGFLVLDCPIKTDSKSVVLELQKSGHNCVMITGDALLTAAEVARQVGIAGKSKLEPEIFQIGVRKQDSATIQKDLLDWLEYSPLQKTAIGTVGTMFSKTNLKSLKEAVAMGEVVLCITGDVLVEIARLAIRIHNPSGHVEEKRILLSTPAQNALAMLVPFISVFARHAPHHKEAVVAAFNLSGATTLMCGDGTNDVGALKRAHIGISIINAPHVEAKQREATAKLKKMKKAQKAGKTTSHSGFEASLRQLQEAQEELEQVELGDASVAAPFTSRSISIKCCKDVIQQGRCTLVTTLSIYKILGINCLVNAMVLSKLFLHGVKQGERQMTVLGMAVAGLFYFVTRAEPLPTLSEIRPPSSVLCAQALLSILGQFTIHAVAILIATEAALSFVDPFDPSLVPDGPFNPNVLNSCTFLLTCLATINTFAVNYRGRPFMENLDENKLLYRSLQVCYGVLIVCALEVFPPLNDLLELSELPSVVGTIPDFDNWLVQLVRLVDFRVFLAVLMTLDTGLAFALERFLIRFF